MNSITDMDIRNRILFTQFKSKYAAPLYRLLCELTRDPTACLEVKQMGKQLGTSRVTVNLAIKELEKFGWIQVERQTGTHNRYKIVNPDGTTGGGGM